MMARPRAVLNVNPADEARVVALLAAEYDKAREQLTSESGWKRIERYFYDKLVHEESSWTAAIIAWAQEGCPASWRALKRFIRDRMDQSRFDSMLVQVRAFEITTRGHAPPAYPHGGHVARTLMRNVWVPAVLEHFSIGTGLPPTRSRSATAPSVALYLAKALKKKGVRRLNEPEINRIYWARHKLADRLEAALLPG